MSSSPTSSLAYLYDADAHRVIQKAPLGAVEAMGDYLRHIFSSRMVISTLYTGPRPTTISQDEQADLNDLDRALGKGCLHFHPADRDLGHTEPSMIRFIRQVEGSAPRLPATLCPKTDDDIEDILNEVSAMG
ncbi:MAG: hypothetical protein AAF723_01215, partial [Pseudomonadota bacterium]